MLLDCGCHSAPLSITNPITSFIVVTATQKPQAVADSIIDK
jgi:hypothetical protein